MATAKLESAIQREVKKRLESQGWLVYVTTCNAYQSGLQDLICSHPVHGVRFCDVKRPKGSRLTKAQAQKWPEFERYGWHTWIVTTADEAEEILLGPPNWRLWWRDSYEKYLLRKPADILRDTS